MNAGRPDVSEFAICRINVATARQPIVIPRGHIPVTHSKPGDDMIAGSLLGAQLMDRAYSAKAPA